jgi:hypothetical protein
LRLRKLIKLLEILKVKFSFFKTKIKKELGSSSVDGERNDRKSAHKDRNEKIRRESGITRYGLDADVNFIKLKVKMLFYFIMNLLFSFCLSLIFIYFILVSK